jgi:anhydro-N-acetylmuramic acid kinase
MRRWCQYTIRRLAATLDWPQPVAVASIGGVANLTYVEGNDPLPAFDTGPGNPLLDDFMHVRTGEPWDEDGAVVIAPSSPRSAIIRFSSLHPPKSLDRNAFAGLDLLADDGPRRGRYAHPAEPSRPRATTDRARLAAGLLLAAAPATRRCWRCSPPGSLRIGWSGPNAIGWSSDATEARAFAYLAVRVPCRGHPSPFRAPPASRGRCQAGGGSATGQGAIKHATIATGNRAA